MPTFVYVMFAVVGVTAVFLIIGFRTGVKGRGLFYSIIGILLSVALSVGTMLYAAALGPRPMTTSFLGISLGIMFGSVLSFIASAVLDDFPSSGDEDS